LRKVRAGINTARSAGSAFHLWTHTWNLADDPAFHLSLMREILDGVARDRDAGHHRVETMGAMAARLSAQSDTGS
jgi:hypothetical protein